MNELKTLYFVKFSDGATYCPGPAGPVGYVSQEMAQETAGTINGHVVERTVEYAVNWCQERNATLFVRDADGKTYYHPETASPEAAKPQTKTVRVEGEERQRLIEISQQQMEMNDT